MALNQKAKIIYPSKFMVLLKTWVMIFECLRLTVIYWSQHKKRVHFFRNNCFTVITYTFKSIVCDVYPCILCMFFCLFVCLFSYRRVFSLRNKSKLLIDFQSEEVRVSDCLFYLKFWQSAYQIKYCYSLSAAIPSQLWTRLSRVSASSQAKLISPSSLYLKEEEGTSLSSADLTP